MFKFAIGQAVSWLISTPQGAALFASVLGTLLTVLAYFTDGLGLPGPFSYGVIFVITLFVTFAFTLLGGFIWLQISQRLSTNKPTYVEFKVEHGRLNLLSKSNIYKEPSVNLTIAVPQQLIFLTSSAKGSKPQKGGGSPIPQPSPAAQPPAQDKPQAFIIVLFERPISTSSFHLRLEAVAGVVPRKEQSGMDEKWCFIGISEIHDNCIFKIRFN